MTHRSSQGWQEAFPTLTLLSATFLFLSAGCSILIQPGAGGGCLNASVPRGFPDTRQLTHTAHGSTELPEPCSAGTLCQVWLRGILPCHGSGCFLLEVAACGSPFILLLGQLLQAGMPGQPPPQPEPLGTAESAPSSPHRLHPGLPQPIPTCSLLNALAQPHPHLMGPTWAAPAHAGAHREQGPWP